MNSWESEINAKNLERVLSISFQLQNVNSFEKSLNSALPAQEEKIEKSGLEIKEKLQADLAGLQAAKKAFFHQMDSLVGTIGVLPAGQIDRKILKGFEASVTDVPKQYSYNQIYSGEALEKAASMREFNACADGYVKDCIEEIRLTAVISNLQDDQIIPLSKALADQLGFSEDAEKE